MGSKKLTAGIVGRAKPQENAYDLRCGDITGLLLRVHPTGRRAFYVEWGRGKRRRLGLYPVMTLDAARTQALTALAEAAATGTPAIGKTKAKIQTLRTFINDEYEPWVVANRKAGESTVARIKAAFPDLLDKPLSALDALLLDRWRLKRVRAGIQPTTINRDLIALKAAVAKSVEWKMLDSNPIAGVKPSKVDQEERVRFLRDDEEARLRQSLKQRDQEAIAARRSANLWREERGQEQLPELPAGGFADHLTPFVLVSMNCGTRRGELTGLEWPAVDLKRRQLTVKAATSKGAKSRHIPLNDEALDVLTRWRKQCKGDRVFPIESIKTAWRALMERAKITDFRPHDMRHHFASRLVQADTNLYLVQRLLGHGSLRMTERYAHVKESNLAEAVAKL